MYIICINFIVFCILCVYYALVNPVGRVGSLYWDFFFFSKLKNRIFFFRANAPLSRLRTYLPIIYTQYTEYRGGEVQKIDTIHIKYTHFSSPESPAGRPSPELSAEKHLPVDSSSIQKVLNKNLRRRSSRKLVAATVVIARLLTSLLQPR